MEIDYVVIVMKDLYVMMMATVGVRVEIAPTAEVPIVESILLL